MENPESSTSTSLTPKVEMVQESELETARAALKHGNVAEAERRLRVLLGRNPEHAEALHLLGLIAQRRGEAGNAREHLRRVVAIDPERGEAWAHLAEVLRSLNEHAEAVAAGRRAVELQPEWAPAHNNLGLALQESGDLAAAEEALRRAVALDPRYPKARYNLGNALRQRDALEEAEASLREALQLQPRYPQALNALGVVLEARGRLDDAAGCFRRAIRMAPRYPKPLLNFGNLLARRQQYDEALRCYDQALRVRRDYAEAWLAKATLFQRWERYDAALDAALRAGRLRPDDPQGPLRLGQIHFARRAYPEAISCFERALELDPEQGESICALAQARGEVCLWQQRDEEMEAVRGAIARAREAGEPCPMAPFEVFLPFRQEELLDLARDAAERTLREAAPDRAELGPPPAPEAGAGERRLRLGYLSSDFRNNALAHLTRRLYGLHDRRRFEVFGYSLGPDDGSEYRRGIAADCDHFVDLRRATDGEAARRIRDDGVDILIDLVGFARGGRPGIPARRPAPIQVVYLYAGSMGGLFHDYFLGDPTVSPPEHADRFGEKLVLLPHCYQINDHLQPIAEIGISRAEEGLPEDGFVFSCFNKQAKIDPVIFDTWMKVLAQVPGSVLWLLETAPAAENLRREAAARGIAPERLVFGRFRSKPEHLARHRLADLALDTWVCGAHTTASDALWTGLPLLTCPGDAFATRVATSLLNTLGLPELVMPDLDTYEQTAVKLAHDPAALAALGDKLAAQRTSRPLFDTPRSVRNLERAYLAMWVRHLAGEAPEMLILQKEKGED